MNGRKWDSKGIERKEDGLSKAINNETIDETIKEEPQKKKIKINEKKKKMIVIWKRE